MDIGEMEEGKEEWGPIQLNNPSDSKQHKLYCLALEWRFRSSEFTPTGLRIRDML